jgi:hypothetical protein
MWRGCCLDLEVPLHKGIRIREVLVKSPEHRPIGMRIIDYWPTAEIEERREALATHGPLGVNWKTLRGTQRTAEMLYDSRSQPEAQAAVMLAAFVMDQQRRSILQSDRLRTIGMAARMALQEHDVGGWHTHMRSALPLDVVKVNWAFRELDDLVHLAVLNAALATSVWTPVVVSHDDRAGISKLP